MTSKILPLPSQSLTFSSSHTQLLHQFTLRPRIRPSVHPSTNPRQTPQRRHMGIRSLTKNPHHSRFNNNTSATPLFSSPRAALQRKLDADVLPLRPGALATKSGMSSIFDPQTGTRSAVTILQLDRVQVTHHKTRKREGYFAVQVGSGAKTVDNVTKPLLGHFASAGTPAKRHVREFRVRGQAGLDGAPVGSWITASHFLPGQYVDAQSVSKGKGFQGVMKRWGMHGQDRSHGVSLAHRSMGSAGPGQGGGSRVYPGKKMAGNMGAEVRTQQALKVVSVDVGSGMVVVKGAVSGPRGGLVKLRDAVKKRWPEVPTAVAAEGVGGEKELAAAAAAAA
ncbi:MAG: hypothetical protein Q9227_008601 [Pyrenula ochraceoflavens]